ncbi:D-beta-hydroxybutyrate dehydrogenase, mitochondrial [Portunus trituberculatus]|uniref:D-beta-hydroxybutyrate dehydrogenase, mitochondrial n=1 Tax=Portunus trituberculatus TaxID=210409 RepID=A0A5B7EXM7_PORTR|nr:D-beta-hydroxybutyrate dehydrogenase, mitochondrial [Portunus trituberculatus]
MTQDDDRPSEQLTSFGLNFASCKTQARPARLRGTVQFELKDESKEVVQHGGYSPFPLEMMVWAAGGVATGMVLLAAHSWRRLRRRREVYGGSKVVVVTGCDSGIGYNVALNTLEWGCSVVATCLDPDGEAPRRLSEAGAVVVKLDLRHLQQDAFKELLSVLQSLKDDDKDLWCLVNNAAVMTYAQCEWQTNEMVTSQVEVNLLGLIQVTKVLLPTLRRNKGRVVIVSSPTGQVAVPNMTVYAATKWGVEGFSHALRRELTPQGGSVVLVRPCEYLPPI